MPAIGVHLIAAGIVAALAFWLWAPLGVLAVLLLLNALRLVVRPPVVARTDADGLRLGGPRVVRVAWSEVEDVSVDGGRLVVDRGDAGGVTFPLAYVGARATELVRDVHDRLNAAHGYRRFDPEA